MKWRLAARLRWLRRLVSRGEWGARILGLPHFEDTSSEPGLILIQIDGLSRTQFERALERGRLPFLQRLLGREDYRIHTMYSGFPSTTPSVQGELFYGIRPAVPAFSFLSREEGRVVRMLEPEVVMGIQRELESKAMGLLEGGSAYSDIYSGGAGEAHFCSVTLGWSHAVKASNPFKFILWIVLHFGSVLRLLLLAPLEILLALIDFFRAAHFGLHLGKELKFIPTRLLICILLREWITAGAIMDAARGLPVIHLNFLGYDEQAHRRGPGSEFAHWTLKGIDFAIRRIVGAARRSVRRQYEVWVYSDHGQEHTVPYANEYGRTLQEAVQEIFSGFSSPATPASIVEEGIRSQRARYLGGSRPGRFLPRVATLHAPIGEAQYSLTAMGPVAHINFSEGFDRSLLPELAKKLVKEGGVPAVLVSAGPDRAQAWTPRGVHNLPEATDAVIGENHPFARELSRELLEVCAHPDAGDLVLLGWRPDGRPLSFPVENGAHAGPGFQETLAFVLTPASVQLESEPGADYTRPSRLRTAALKHLGRLDMTEPAEETAPHDETAA